MTTHSSLKFDINLGVLFSFTVCLERHIHILFLMAD